MIFSLSPVDDGEVPLREKEKKVRPFSMLDSVDQSAGPAPCGGLRKNQSSEDILRDAQVRWDSSVLTPAARSVHAPQKRDYCMRESRKTNENISAR